MDGTSEHLEKGLHIRIYLCTLGYGVLHYRLGSALLGFVRGTWVVHE
jgi:hypothetical protein